MKNTLLNSAILLALALILTGCGDSSSEPLKTQGSAKVFLFGTMSSSRKIATLHTEVIIPSGIMLNYSSPPGGTGKYPLRSGVIVPSGSVTFSQSDITAEFRVSDRTLFVDCINWPDSTGFRKNIRSGSVGDGVEIATLNFKLATADAYPSLPTLWQNVILSVGEEKNGTTLDVTYANALKLNFATSFSP
jgi:hypothetical protein